MGLFSFLSESGKGCTATISSDQFVVEVFNSLTPLILVYLSLFPLSKWFLKFIRYWRLSGVLSVAPMFVVYVNVLEK